MLEFLALVILLAPGLALAILLDRRPRLAARFADATPSIRLDAPGARAFTVDHGARTISGLLLPWNTEARSGGYTWSFAPGSVGFSDPTRVKLWIQHDPNRAVGYATALESRDDGLYGSFRVARGAAGDEALTMAEDRVWDGFSVGIAEGGTYTERDGVVYAEAPGSAPLMETSLTPAPAYDDARVHSVAATAARLNTGGNMDCTTCGQNHAAGVACDPAAVAAFAATAAANTPAPTLEDRISSAIAAGFEALGTSLERPQPIAAGDGLEVHEAAPYRFDGLTSEHDFSTDLVAFGRDRNGDAGNRLMRFMAEAFAPGRNPAAAFGPLTPADVSALNPARQRPDLFVDERQYATPVYNALYSGAITDNTPFIVPKFVSDSGLVANHVSGTEPTPGDYTVTSQTVTPTPLSGKVEIPREVWDQGGNPQVSGLIWSRMVYEYMRNLESEAAAVLTANAASITDIALTTGATDDALVSELEGKLADLQFVAGGELLSMALTHVDLYKALVNAVDSTGRKLLPIYGPSNANGGAQSRFKSLDVAGYEFAPAWSLGAASSASSNSWLIDKGAVHLWNSAPQRLEFEYRVAYVDLAVWGYKAAAVTDTAGVRQLTYDPVV